MDKTHSPKPKKAKEADAPSSPSSSPPAKAKIPPLFRPIDWWAFGLTSFLVMLGYWLSLAPDVTLEDSGELAVGSMYAGVPHPPGYPVWTIYTWLFTKLVPFSNIAWRVALASAFAGAMSCGLIALMVSRGSSMMVESIAELKDMDRRWENAICLVSGYVSGMLFGFNGFMWSQSVIVEVYTLSVWSLTAVMVFLMRWMYAPDQMRWLYIAFFLFGICFTNHQTLLVAAMGVQVAIVFRMPKLGRDMLLGNSAVYLVGLIMKANGHLSSFDNNAPLFMIYNMVGLASMAGCAWLTMKTGGFLTEWRPVLILAGMWVLGAAFYLYMPLAGMTNPPMNWGYPRTVEGFIHALTRGQYERANPTNIFQDPLRFIGQLRMYTVGAIEEFNFVYLLIGLVPYFFYRRMQAREKSWIAGLTGIFLCLAVLLLMLLNPAPDRQSKELNRVFFTASHVIVAMGIGYGMALIGAVLQTHYELYRRWALFGFSAAAGLALYGFASLESLQPLARYTSMFGLGLAIAAVALVLFMRERFYLPALLALFFVTPTYSIMTHWADNEQRGHLFGYWFGHDMFTPPFKDTAGNPLYPEMAKDTVLFGGTDPGRFNPTYMIFCESFMPPEKKPLDPKFDRRDVYLITQNALADNTYLSYIRAHYNRSTQIDPPFFQELFRSEKERNLGQTNLLSRLVSPLDRIFTSLGAKIEADRRARGVYPPREIKTPTPEDSSKAFNDYIRDASERLQRNQLKPGEDVKVIENRIQVSGQVAVMSINGLLTKMIFDANPGHEFYVEESFPLDWMYPHLSPFGIIMKINRQPLGEITDEMVKRDHDFWRQYSTRLTGDWITYDTSVKDICDFAERVYRRGDYTGFTGDPKFIRDDNAQKAFSKLRSAIAGVYRWRVTNAKTPAEQQRMMKEADFAFRQALAYCPYSPEAVYRYIDLLASMNRLDDALLIAETCYKFDQDNAAIQNLVMQIRGMKQSGGGTAQIQQQLEMAEMQFRANSSNAALGLTLVSTYLQLGKTNEAVQALDRLASNSTNDVQSMLQIAHLYSQMGMGQRLEKSLARIVVLMPENPEAWYDLSAVQTALGKPKEALTALGQALNASDVRLAKKADSRDLRREAPSDARFAALRPLPEFDQVVASKPER
ncbi:MAG: DUF2723 domain-containing protein [Verrucomicrobia bacterium]|nr:DUF2723 domain-containing protein [Verrucomicrobiota bacterium]